MSRVRNTDWRTCVCKSLVRAKVPESLRGFRHISIRVQRPLDWKLRNSPLRNGMIANQFDATVEINKNSDTFSANDAG